MRTYQEFDDSSFLDTRPDPVPGRPRKGDELWVIHMSHNPVAAMRGLKEGFICVGWVEAGDLRRYPTQHVMKAAFDKHYPGRKPGQISHWAGDALRFLSGMGKGDLFVFPVTGGDEIHIGEITGDYEFASTDAELVASDSAHLRRVRWFTTVSRSRFTREALKCFDSEHTVHSGSGYRKQVADVLAALPGDSVKSNGAQIEQS